MFKLVLKYISPFNKINYHASINSAPIKKKGLEYGKINKGACGFPSIPFK
jgi:hypothetical protein